ncbi:hypothetical protein [Micromonospora avicenniae]|uniref:hypothetical protein n=1 Tax=Micromonospora avicenniae TaxID=1198245 RepID=UPI0034144EE5
MKDDHDGARGTRDAGTPTGIGVATGAVLVVGATLLAAALFSPAELSGRVAVVAIAVGGYAALVPGLRALAAVTLLAVACFIGFLVNRFGELTDVSGEVWAYAAVIGFAAVLGVGYRYLCALARRPSPRSGSPRRPEPGSSGVRPAPQLTGRNGRTCGPVHPGTGGP